MKKSYWFLTAVAIIIALGAGIYLRSGRAEGPNLLLITMDTVRADHLGCYGYPSARTPALDKLAAGGVKFDRVFANVPLTLPSHGTMMTGLYPPEHGCRVNGSHGLPEELTTLAEVFKSHGYQTAAFVAAFVLDSKFGLSQGFQTYDQYDVPTSSDIYDDNLMYRYRRGDKVAAAALTWLKKHSRTPFFCWVHFYDPHRPYYFPGPDLKSAYDREITFMDRQIKRLIDYLKRQKLLEKTVIIALGDHGEGLGEHGEDEHGLLLYNPTLRIPLIIARPGPSPRKKKVEELVSTVDLFPTVLDLFGWKLPGHVSGRSFAGALEGEAVPDRAVYLETEFPLTEYGWSPLQGVIASEWKYIAAPEEELYNIRDDPGEKKNLAAVEPGKAKELKAKLAALEDKLVKKEAAAVKLDSSSRKALESLGYMGGGGSRKKETSSLRNPEEAVWMRREFIRAVEECRQGHTAAAELKLKKLIKESPESYAFHYKLARILYDQGRFREALGEFREMARMSPEEYRTHYNLGKTLLKLSQYQAAIRELQAALKLDPDQTPGYNNLGIAFLKAGRIQEAMAAFRKSIVIDPDQVDPHNNLGNSFLSLGQIRAAEKEFRKAVEADPDFFEGRYNLGLTLFRLGRYEAAAREFREAVRIRPDFAEARRQLKIALRRAGMN